MRDALAEQLLAQVMKWERADVSTETPDLQAMAALKYDEYQQFAAGMRFVESLARWLGQFTTDEQRKLAYQFVRNQLVYVSQAEMKHFVSIAYHDLIRPFLLRQLACSLGVPDWSLHRLANSPEFKYFLRRSLVLGLSDGAHIDEFRRSSPFSHEQISGGYEISDAKMADMLSKLRSDLQNHPGSPPDSSRARFRFVFLLDDFSASGLSYLRKDSSGRFAGKIERILSRFQARTPLQRLFSRDRSMGSLSALVGDASDFHVCIVLYLATTKAIKHLQNLIGEWVGVRQSGMKCSVLTVQTIPETTPEVLLGDPTLLQLLEEFFDDSIINDHYRIGKHDRPYLGFDECALPVVLSHNTPNNSVPLLWFEEGRKYLGLFPRVSRHRREL